MSVLTAERHYTLAHTFGDAMAIAKRNLIRYKRVPTLIVFSTIQPVMFVLLFNYVFGGAVRNTGPFGYQDFLMPGIFVQTVVFGSMQTGIGLADDISQGLIDRFRSLPMARSAVLAGRTISDTVRNVVVVLLMTAVGMLIGFRFHAGFPAAVAALGLAVLFGFAFSWISASIGLAIKDTEATQAASFVWIFPLTFASAAFVPVETMPGWMQAWAKVQPVSVTVEAIRGFVLGGPTAVHLWKSLAWIAGMLAVFIPLSVRKYRST